MKLYERFADRGFHTTIVTTFGVEFDAYESIVLPRLRGSGCHNNILVGDARMLGYALSSEPARPQFAGRLYSVTGVAPRGVFHPKLVLQIGRRRGRLIIGSANATTSGLAGNLELAGIIECEEDETGTQRLVAAAWTYLSRLLTRRHRGIAQQLSWMQARAPWLEVTGSGSEVVSLPDGTEAAFLSTGEASGILERFVALIEGQPVEALTVISPYWDQDLATVKELQARLQPSECSLLIDKDRKLFPGPALADLRLTNVLDIRAAFSESRFVHGKLFVAKTAEHDHVLFGSANCTVAALGTQAFQGRNDEACLYRKLPRDAVDEALGLRSITARAIALSEEDIPPLQIEDEIPVDDLDSRNPGSFECMFDSLYWRPPSRVPSDECDIVLLAQDGTEITCSLIRISTHSDGEVRFQINGASARPGLAQVRFPDGQLSIVAVVSLVDVLRTEVRESRTKEGDNAAARLNEETEEGLWLLEVLDDLEAAESLRSGEADPTTRKKEKDRSDCEDVEYRTLRYEEFVAGRRLRSDSAGVARNSLAGSEVSLVRAFLNRMLAIESAGESSDPEAEDTDLSKAFDLGDEVADAEDAIEGGVEFDSGPHDREDQRAAHDDVAEQRKDNQRRATRRKIGEVVKTFIGGIRERAEENGLTTRDVLRLRATLTIVSAAGWTGPDGRIAANSHGAHRTSLQVLPKYGSNDCWPRMLGQVLFSLFGGRKPAIQFLQLDESYDQIPDDLVESWACCFWASQACLLATRNESNLASLNRSASSLLEHVYLRVGLPPDQLLSDPVLRVMRAMGDRFSTRLGVDADSVMKSHEKYVAGMASAQSGESLFP